MLSWEHLHRYGPWVVVLAAACVAAVIDLRSRRIPNYLTGPLLLCGLCWAACGGLGADPWGSVGRSLGGAAIASAPFVLMWLMGGTGAGDAKLMMGAGAWLGTAAAVPVLLATAILGGVISLVVLVCSTTGARTTLAGAPRSVMGLSAALLSIASVSVRGATHRDDASAGASAVPMRAAMKIRVPYAAAICGGTCAAAFWVLR